MSHRERLLSRLAALALVSFARSTVRPPRKYMLSLALLLVGSVLAALLVQSLPSEDHLYVGNTAGALTAMFEIDGQRVLVGAGPTRAHAADFVGRSTRPWSSHIDLLLVPAWDDTHAVGALGLLERRSVSGIGVIGTPGDDPIWTLLERRAQQDDVPVRFLSSPHRLELNTGVTLLVTDLDRPQPGAWTRLDYHGTRFDLIDADAAEPALPPASAFQRRNRHILINMREQGVPEFTYPSLLLRPMPFIDGEFRDTKASYVRDIARNEQVRLELTPGEIRLPLEGIDY